MIKQLLKRLLKEPMSVGLDLDSSEATVVHRSLIKRKQNLKCLYSRYYSEFEKVANASLGKGIKLEIGSGGGFLQERLPKLIKLDLRPGAHVDCVASAMELPFAGQSVSSIFMLNVLHHVQDPKAFFQEADRVLVTGGRIVMIEPYVSVLSKLIYKHLHHEPFNHRQEDWTLSGNSAMSIANDALPWIIFNRDRHIFEELFKSLKIVRIEPHTLLLYLVSGGLSYRTLLPSWAFSNLAALEDKLGPLHRLLSSMMTVEIIKT